MKCPICHKPVTMESPEFPFCSQRCRTIDLGNWATERYVISTPLTNAPPLPEEAEETDAADENA